MCGIAGAFGRVRDAAAVERMSARIAHRGPDDVGDAPLAGGEGAGAFAHRRLAILDLSPCGHQPMASPDGRLIMVFNGEIYNFRALKAELEAEGDRFKGGSDTEVILAGWARYGPAYLERLRGMFALVLWDRQAGRGWLARDRFGIKPLYVAESSGAVLFASETRALLASGMVDATLSRSAVAQYLEAGSVTEPHTLFRAVRSLPAGSVTEVTLRGDRATLGPSRIFARALEPAPESEVARDAAAAARLVREALRDSVEHHLVSDVTVAMFLSGGIDSSALVAVAAEATGRPLDTFTVVFGEQQFDESGPASAVAKRFASKHQEIPLTGDDFASALPDAFAAMDQPSMDGLNTYVISRAVRRAGLKVVLSGLGGDELFAGYPSFRRAASLPRFWRGVRPARRLAARVASSGGGIRAEKLGLLLEHDDPALAAYRASRALFAGDLIAALSGERPALDSEPPPEGLSLLQRVSWYELTGYMRNTLLRDSDVFSMASALELRVPFVDQVVAGASVRVDDALKLASGSSKPVLVAAVRDLLPREVWDRPKQGFTLPFDRWMRGPLKTDVGDALTPRRLSRVGIDARAARGIWDGFLAGRKGFTWARPWALYTLVRWAEGLDAAVEAPPGAALAHSGR